MKKPFPNRAKATLRGCRKLLGFSVLRLEPLESRALLSGNSVLGPTPDLKATEQVHFLDSPISSASVAYSPNQVQTAYGFEESPSTGAGQTIAIVDAFDDPNIQQDLAVFDQKYNLPAANLTKVEMTSGGQSPSSNPAWSSETALDVEWAHAVAPGASILLVEAYNDSVPNLMSAVDAARNAPGVSVVSMSWGVSEFAGETDYDSLFTTPAGHTPVSFVAASGDSGTVGGPYWPAVAANVLSVGGTTLNLSDDGQYDGETAWTDSGQGTSTQVPEPPYQMGVQSTGQRTIPDVAYNADPTTGYSVYDSVPNQQDVGWQTVGGTSAGAPQWAGLLAIADQARAAAGKNAIGDAPAAMYTLPSDDFHSLLASSGFGLVATAAGNVTINDYEAQTGLGTPVANNLVSDLSAANLPLLLPEASGPAPPSTGAGPGSYGLSTGSGSTSSSGATSTGPPSQTPPAKPLDDNGNGTGESGSGDSSPGGEAGNGSPPSGSTEIAQGFGVAVTLVASSSTNTGALQLSPAQSAATSNAQPTAGPATSNETVRVDTALHASTAAGVTLVRGLELDPQSDPPPGQQDAATSLLGENNFQLDWPDSHLNQTTRPKHAGSAVPAPVLIAKRHDAEADAEDENADSLSAIDHCFASGAWIERILSAHPDAELPRQLGDVAVTMMIAGVDDAAPDYGILAVGDGELSADHLWVAAAVAAGAYWQISRSSTAEASDGSTEKPRPDFLNLTSRFREAKLAWASTHRTTKPR